MDTINNISTNTLTRKRVWTWYLILSIIYSSITIVGSLVLFLVMGLSFFFFPEIFWFFLFMHIFGLPIWSLFTIVMLTVMLVKKIEGVALWLPFLSMLNFISSYMSSSYFFITISSFVFSIIILIIAGAFVARFIPTNYHAEYYIGQDKYSIPWQYNPSGSYSFTDNVHSSNPSLTVSKGILNRKEISIRVSHPGLFAEHSSVGYKSTEKVTLSRSILGEKAEIGASFDDMCNENICVGVSNRSNPAYRYFVDSGFLYKIVFPGNTMPFSYRSELDDYKKSVVDLFDSFKVR